MATSGVVSSVPFDNLKIIELAYTRCGIERANITPQMVITGQQLLHTFLGSFSNRLIPSWCIDRLVMPMYEGINYVDLPDGTINALNVNYRQLQALADDTPITPLVEYIYSAANVSTVGVKWNSATSPEIFLYASADSTTWVQVGTIEAGYLEGTWSWVDVPFITDYQYFKLATDTADTIDALRIYLGNMPQEIPFGALNRDQYVDQSNKVFLGRPTDYWPQKNYPLLRLNLWPCPNVAAEVCQLVVWRYRHVMDVGTMRQNIEMPIQWQDAVVANLAVELSLTLPNTPTDRISLLMGFAERKLNAAWEGDGDGTQTNIQVNIAPYTR